MTVREEDRKSMRHSSSWPDWTPQTVKVRVDPLSRAFTIIPTIRESFHPLLTVARPGWIDEIVLLDHGRSSTDTKHRFVDEAKIVERRAREKLEETFELRAFVSGVTNSTSGRSKTTLPRSLSCDESTTIKANQTAPERMKPSRSMIDEDCSTRREKLRKPLSKGSTLEDSKEDVKSDADCPAAKTIVQIEPVKDQGSLEENPASSGRVTAPGRSPVNQIPENAASSHAATRRSQHVCPKCTSEGLLDPFRSPASSDKSNPIGGGRCRVAGSGKAETLRKYSAVEAKMRTSWQRIGATGLIGATRNRNKQRGQRRNGEPLCRSTNDVRKEATLRRHYYPEGGWGYVIVTCSTLVHLLGIGLQLAAPGSWHITAELKFHQPPLHSAGKMQL
ncbi:uncharacterized protein LOC143362248 [Halictus rubicundus]|uniref:uncharacterized protein LOC143362248 n=1 Tax=Halictus rubicundus TaxID=77578 RepID=UPI00403530D0